MSEKNNVYRFDAESWCVVHCRENSGVVQVTSNIATEYLAQQYAENMRLCGGHVFRVVQAGVLVAVLEFSDKLDLITEMRDFVWEIANDTSDRASGGLTGKAVAIIDKPTIKQEVAT